MKPQVHYIEKSKRNVFSQYCVRTRSRHLADSFYWVNWKKTKDAENEGPGATSETFKGSAKTSYPCFVHLYC